MACEDVGKANGGIAGIGIICAFTIQAGFSILLSLWSCILAFFWEPSVKSLKFINKILALISNIQVMTGIALLVAGIISQHQSIDLYHQHIIYDTVSFTGVSFSAALLGIFVAKASNHPPADTSDAKLSFFSSLLAVLISTQFLMTFFTILYLVFVIRFGKALRQWDDKIPGRCYHFDYIASPRSSHPLVDELYLAFTALSSFIVLFVGLPFASPPTGKFWKWMGRTWRFALDPSNSRSPYHHEFARRYIPKILFIFVFLTAVFLILLQYPLHLYMIIQLRKANPHNAGNGESEDRWDFGQVAALVLILPVVKECIAGYIDIKD